ncbi:MAG: exodeoxyribonuclease III [Bacteroidia bacterium]|nr:exodeoxyribonuclease III [Bacteroidia bacterium]
MKIITYNINGLRAAIRKNILHWIEQQNADILCLQETKLQAHQIPKELQWLRIPYLTYWSHAQKPGYSGVAVFTQFKPMEVIEGIGIKEFDIEGRTLTLVYEKFCVVCAYFPSGSSGRLSYKLRHLEAFKSYMERLKNKHAHVLICADVNVCHKPIDIHNPKENENKSGFLPEERAYIDAFIDLGYFDTFRQVNSLPHQYTWWDLRTGAKKQNKGWRIDYIFATNNLKNKIQNAFLIPQVNFSDHCPMVLEIEI